MIWGRIVDRRSDSPFFFFNDAASTEIYTLSLHDALPIYPAAHAREHAIRAEVRATDRGGIDRKSTRLNSSHQISSYAVFCLKKKNHAAVARVERGRLETSPVAPRVVPGRQPHDVRALAALLVEQLDVVFFFFNDTATPEIYTLSLHDALPICAAPECAALGCGGPARGSRAVAAADRSEEHTSELQSPDHLVCRLLLEKKKKKNLQQRKKKKKKTRD